MHRTIEGTLSGANNTFALVTSRFNEMITSKLSQGAIDCLLRHGVREQDITEVFVPGAFEIPVVADRLATSGQFSAIICLGAVIRGATPHFEQVVSAVTSGVSSVSLMKSLPVMFAVLTCDTVDQAMDRAGAKMGNKGWDAALGALEMVNLFKKL